MKKLISFVCLMLCLTNAALADTSNCDWSQATKQADGSYRYPVSLHICVGQLVQDSATQAQQLADLNKAIDLKNLALQNADARTALWEKTSDDEMSRLNKISADSSQDHWLWFGLGVVTVFVAGYAASRAYGH